LQARRHDRALLKGVPPERLTRKIRAVVKHGIYDFVAAKGFFVGKEYRKFGLRTGKGEKKNSFFGKRS